MKLSVRRLMSPLIAILILSLLVTGCAPTATPAATDAVEPAAEQPTSDAAPVDATEPTQAPASAEDITITFLMEGNYTEKGMAAIQEYFIDGFEAAHPGVKLEMNFVEKDIFTITRTALSSEDGPDLVFTTAALIVDLANAGLLNPLDKYAEQYQWQDKLASWAYNSGVISDQLYAMPMGFESMYLYYNKTILDQNGWVPPTNREELETLCAAMAEKGMSCFGSSNTEWKGVNEWWVSV
ncbi:MAG TPA: extracellular solute-binding protein, partial [Anaerolineaceae bacterium]|nr:extracellular solute-binding protein [Anaerolineaceae bacterium]